MHPADRFGRRPPPQPASEMTARRADLSRKIQNPNPESRMRMAARMQGPSHVKIQIANLEPILGLLQSCRIRIQNSECGWTRWGVVARRPPRRKTQNPETRSQAFCLSEFGSDVLHLHTCSTRYSADQACRIQIMIIQMDFARCHSCQARSVREMQPDAPHVLFTLFYKRGRGACPASMCAEPRRGAVPPLALGSETTLASDRQASHWHVLPRRPHRRHPRRHRPRRRRPCLHRRLRRRPLRTDALPARR